MDDRTKNSDMRREIADSIDAHRRHIAELEQIANGLARYAGKDADDLRILVWATEAVAAVERGLAGRSAAHKLSVVLLHAIHAADQSLLPPTVAEREAAAAGQDGSAR